MRNWYFAAVLVLAGCAMPQPQGRWEKNGAVSPEYEQDRKVCEYEAKKATAGSTFAYQAYYGDLVVSCLESKGYRYNRAPRMK